MAEHAMDIPKKRVFKIETGNPLFFPVLVSFSVIIAVILLRSVATWSWRWHNPLLFHVVEGIEFLASILFAVFLITRKTRDAVFNTWIPTGLLGMGLLDWFSNGLESERVWLYSLAMLFGGVCFAAGWLPFHAGIFSDRKWLIFIVAGSAAVALGTLPYALPETVPEMMSAGRFNTTAVAMNSIAGFLFLTAAAFFIKRYLSSRNPQDVLFFYFSLFTAAAELGFRFGIEWAGQWWSWHVFRLTSSLVLFIYAVVLLKKSEDRSLIISDNFSSVLKTSMDGFFIVDSRGRFIGTNDVYCRLIGHGREELVKMSVSDVEAVESPEDVSKHMETIIRNGGDRFETRHRRKDGTIVEVEASVHYLPRGNFFCFVHDISQRRQMMTALKRSEEELSVILENLPLATALMDEKQCVVRMNAALSVLSSFREHAAGKCIGQVFNCIYFSWNPAGCGIHPWCKTCRGRAMLTDTLTTGRNHYQEEWKLPVKTGNDMQEMDLLASTITLQADRKLVLLCLEDVSARKKLQRQLIMNDRLASVGLLASGVAHEIGNPLTVISGYANTLPLIVELPDEAKDGLKVITEESQRAGDILKNLLTFARAESKTKEMMNINGSIRRVLELRAYEHRLNKITTNINLAQELPEILANRSQLEQVFYNIVVNAEFAMIEAHRKGTLTVITSYGDNVARIEFTDDGAGIPEEYIGRIFTPFFTTKKVGQGTGLGLSVCLGIVNQHGGRLWAENHRGRGTTFFIELPVQTQ